MNAKNPVLDRAGAMMDKAALDCGPEACSLTEAQLTASRIGFGGPDEAAEACFERGWTDGLPVVPPTPARVASFLDAAGLAPDEVLGTIPTRENLVFTAEKLAINAVMAGAKPEYMRVIVAAMRAFLDPRSALHGHSATLSGAQQVTIVNGPIRRELGINCGDGAFGPGWRANSTIGRALRLAMRNIGRSLHGEFDRSSYSHPGRYSWCFGEAEEESPWQSIAADAGLGAGANAVTTYATMWQIPISSDARDAAALARRLGRGARQSGAVGGGSLKLADAEKDEFYQRPLLFVIGRQHARVVHGGGMSKAALKEAMFRAMTEPGGDLPPMAIASPDKVLLAYVDAVAMQWSWYFAPFTYSIAVTRAIE
jgi:hypothetical protein